MDPKHIKLQYDRLKRHYQAALETKDPISFLDLSHTLRIWVDMKFEVDDLVREASVSLDFINPVQQKAVKKLLRGTRYTSMTLGSGVENPGFRIRKFEIFDRILSPEEVKELHEAEPPGPPPARKTKLTFTEWLGSGLIRIPTSDQRHPGMSISREILVKRVANILGASHPQGTDFSDDIENRFDPYIMELHRIELAGGYPIPYYLLLEIAKDILNCMEKVLQ